VNSSKSIVAAAVIVGAVLSVGAACAAGSPGDPTTGTPATLAEVYNWTGFYIGLEGGGDWGRSRHYQDDPAAAAGGKLGVNANGTTNLGLPESGAIDLSGALLGGTAGYNYQFSNNIVVGIENDFSWTSTKGSTNVIPPFNTAVTLQTAQTWLDTLRGRIGYAWKQVLVYGTGGAAFTNEGILLCDPIVAACGSQSKMVTGWTAGAGAEYAVRANWTVKLEYLHADFGSQFYPRTYAQGRNGPGFFDARSVTLTNDIVRAGVNYKFGSGGEAAAPE
jgi:outer membrane immunogenic protein